MDHDQVIHKIIGGGDVMNRAGGDGAFGGTGMGLLLGLLLGRGAFGGGFGTPGHCAPTGCENLAATSLVSGKVNGLELQLNQVQQQLNTAGTLAGIAGVVGAVREVGAEVREGTAANNAAFALLSGQVKDSSFALASAIKDGNYALQTSMDKGFCTISNQIKDAATVLSTQATNNHNAVVGMFTAQAMDALRTENAKLSAKLSNAHQTDHLEHFIRRELQERIPCRTAFADGCGGSGRSGGGFSAGGIGSGNGSGNTVIELAQTIAAAKGIAFGPTTAV